MCGIVAAIAERPVQSILLGGPKSGWNIVDMTQLVWPHWLAVIFSESVLKERLLNSSRC